MIYLIQGENFMIYTITLNPCLDITKSQLQENDFIVPGGKGINVSIMLSRLKTPNIALGFIGGNTGEIIEQSLSVEGVKTDFVCIEASNRMNVKTLKDGRVIENNGIGPYVSPENIKELFAKLNNLIDGDYLIMSGSLPSGVSAKIYGEIIKYVSNRNIRCVVDGRGEALLHSLEFHPYLIKPNLEELLELFEDKNCDLDAIVTKAKILQEKGAENVIVSLGGDGAMLLTSEGKIINLPAHKGKVVNTVGAGDSLVAGFIASITRNLDYEEALRFGIACGSATSFKLWLARLIDVVMLL